MKQKHFILVLTILMSMVASVALAHDFEVGGIYYNITSSDNLTVTVTYQGESYDSYSDEYTGSVAVPESVTYNGQTYSVTSIGNLAFAYCRTLNSVTIGKNVTSIVGGAFYRCNGLTKAEFANIESLCRIKFGDSNANPLSYAHHLYIGGNEVTDLVIPNSVTSIGEDAFRGCSGLTSVTIPNSVTSIGKEAFSGCSGLTKAEFASIESLCSIQFSPNKANPLYYAHHLYVDSKEVTDLVIPSSVTSIGNYTFNGCSGLTSVTIGNSVASIGSSAFSGCSGLTSITIPNCVTSIGYGTFAGCSGLTSITISNSVTSISESAFDGCSGLTSIIIGSSVTSIGDYAFYNCSGLTSITIPNSVTSIGKEAFRDCRGLTSITIPNSVTSIGNWAFMGCSGLTSVTINSNAIASKRYDKNSTLAGIFGSQVTAYIFGEGVRGIGKCACYNCSSLISLTIDNNVTSIGESAFACCSGLTSVTIPNSVTTIGNYAFDDTAWYNNQPDGVVYAGTVAYKYKGSMPEATEIILQDGTSGIAGEAFSGCVGLTSVTIPNSVTSIGSSAFQGCSSLTSVTINSNTIASKSYSDSSTLAGIFGSQVTAYIFGEGVQGIGQYACYNCSSLTSLTIPESLTSIGNSTFQGCNGLTYITIPSSVTNIGGSAFQNCSGLTSITIPNSVTSIGPSAFDSCSGLTSISIPNSVNYIGNYAFEGCGSLKNLVFEDGESTLSLGFTYNSTGTGTGMFASLPLETLYLGRNLKYDKRESYGYSPFYNITSLISLTIGNNVTSIDNWQFSGCSGLTSVIIPNSVTSIGSSAFSGCSGLTSVIIPNSVTNIGESTFSGCSALTSVIIGSSVTSIGENAFYKTNLKSVTIGAGVVSIATNAFSYNTTNEVANGARPTKVIWLTNTPPSGYENVNGKVNYVANEQYTSLSSKTVYPYLSSIFEVGGVRYVPVSPSERTCDAIDCNYDSSAENINIRKTLSYRGVSLKVQSVQPYVCYENPYITEAVLDYENNIPDYAFYNCTKMTSATIGNEVTAICESAFENCRKLTSITIPNSVTSIGNYVFNGCTGIKDLVIEDGERTLSLGYNTYNSDKAGKGLFESCPLKTLYLGRNITYKTGVYYGFSPFRYKPSLQSVTIGNYVTSIGKDLFTLCTGLTSITIPNSVINIGDLAFYNCTGMKSAVIGNSVNQIGSSAFASCSKLTSVTIPNCVISIDYGSFAYCSGLTSINIGNSVQSIGGRAFSGCSVLPSVTIPKSVTSIGDYTFQGCTALKEVIMEEKASEISLGSNGGSPLFADCPLDSVFIGRNISYPTSSESGYSPFYRNTSLRSIHITNVETEVSDNEFYGCTNLKNVRLGDGITKIGKWAFSGCSSLDYFLIGKNTKEIGQEAFSDCTAMTRLITRAPEPPTCGATALDDINKWECTLEVPIGSLSAYQGADQWKEFFFMEEGTTGLRPIDNEQWTMNNGELTIKDVYDLSGRQLNANSQLKRGIYVIRQSDGTTKRVLVK